MNALTLLAAIWPVLPPPSQAPSFHFLVDADVCPSPEEGPFEPRAFSPYEARLREALLPKEDDETILHLVVEPSFDRPFAVRLQGARGEDGVVHRYRLQLVRTDGHPWADLMQAMERQQGTTISLATARLKEGLAKISTATTELTSPISVALARKLEAAWAGVLARTQYVKEILEAPDGTGMTYGTADGTTYHFWHDGRSATTHSPGDGSVLAAFVEVGETLARYVEAPAERVRIEKQLEVQLNHLRKRIRAREPCLRPEPYAPQK